VKLLSMEIVFIVSNASPAMINDPVDAVTDPVLSDVIVAPFAPFSLSYVTVAPPESHAANSNVIKPLAPVTVTVWVADVVGAMQ